jgi:hypothetical protein
MTNGQVKEQVIAMGLFIGQSDSKHHPGSVLRLARQLIGTQKVAAFYATGGFKSIGSLGTTFREKHTPFVSTNICQQLRPR